MSYVLYSAIARAGGIDLLLSNESFTRPYDHPVNRRPSKPYRAPTGAQFPRFAGLRRTQVYAGLRRRGGRALIGLGQALTRWGRQWAPQSGMAAANTNLTFAAK